MTDLSALLSRVENASGPNREIDALLTCAFMQPAPLHGDTTRRYTMLEAGIDYERVTAGHYWSVERSGRSLHSSEHYTASLDVTIALAERRFPNVSRRVSWEQSGLDGKWYGCAEILGLRAVAKTEALAFIAAIIKAEMETENA